MKWVTREKAKVDRIACPWLIKKFIDPKAELLFVPAAASLGFRLNAKDDFDNMSKQFPMYDAIYRYCQQIVEQRHSA